MSAGDAAQVAQVLVLADLFGIHTHGVQRIPQYLGRVDAGGLDLHAQGVAEVVAPAIALVDGANGLGPLVGARALEAAMAPAPPPGAGVALAPRRNPFGPSKPYLF